MAEELAVAAGPTRHSPALIRCNVADYDNGAGHAWSGDTDRVPDVRDMSIGQIQPGHSDTKAALGRMPVTTRSLLDQSAHGQVA